MTPENFCYWLQGFSEINGAAPTPEQWKVVQDHLNLVFHKVTPNRQTEPAPTPFPSFPITIPPYNPGNPFEPSIPEGPVCGGEHYVDPNTQPTYCAPDCSTTAGNPTPPGKNICGGVVPKATENDIFVGKLFSESYITQEYLDSIVKNNYPLDAFPSGAPRPLINITC